MKRYRISRLYFYEKENALSPPPLVATKPRLPEEKAKMPSNSSEEAVPLLPDDSTYTIEETLDSLQEEIGERIEDLQETAEFAAKKISTFWQSFSSFVNSKNLFEVAVGVIYLFYSRYSYGFIIGTPTSSI